MPLLSPFAYNTNAYEKAAIAKKVSSLPPGTAVVLTELPSGPSGTDPYFKVDAANTTDVVFAVVSGTGSNITDKVFGKIVLFNAALIPVLLNAAGTKDQYVKVKTTDGKWGPIGAGEVGVARLVEDGAAGDIVFAMPVQFKP